MCHHLLAADHTLFFFFLKIYLFITCKYTVAGFRHTRRGRQISLQMVVSHHVVAGIWTQDLWRSSQCSYPLSHLASPSCAFFRAQVWWGLLLEAMGSSHLHWNRSAMLLLKSQVCPMDCCLLTSLGSLKERNDFFFFLSPGPYKLTSTQKGPSKFITARSCQNPVMWRLFLNSNSDYFV